MKRGTRSAQRFGVIQLISIPGIDATVSRSHNRDFSRLCARTMQSKFYSMVARLEANRTNKIAMPHASSSMCSAIYGKSARCSVPMTETL